MSVRNLPSSFSVISSFEYFVILGVPDIARYVRDGDLAGYTSQFIQDVISTKKYNFMLVLLFYR